MRLFGFLVLVSIVFGSTAYGDGKFFYREKVPVNVPYQRAILMFEDGNETLVLQSKYKTIEANDVNSIAWVVPVPAVPELASMDAKGAEFMFFLLGHRSQPKVFPIVQVFISISVIVIISFVIAKVLNWFFVKRIKAGAKVRAVSGLRIAIVVIVFFVLIESIMMPTLGKVGIGGVDVLKAETVGIYNVNVIKGDDANAVTQWLIDNGFSFKEEDSKVFDQYVKKGWCFVTAKVGKEVEPNSERTMGEGLAAPLILRFDSREAVYPMALTGITESNTEVLLYIFSDHKMECGNRLKLAFFGKTSSPFKEENPYEVEPKEFFHDKKTKSWQMCKFKGILKPDQMKEDIIFKQAMDDEPYRETKWY